MVFCMQVWFPTLFQLGRVTANGQVWPKNIKKKKKFLEVLQYTLLLGNNTCCWKISFFSERIFFPFLSSYYKHCRRHRTQPQNKNSTEFHLKQPRILYVSIYKKYENKKKVFEIRTFSSSYFFPLKWYFISLFTLQRIQLLVRYRESFFISKTI